MAENKFTLKAVPEIVFDFSLPPKADALSADEEMALTRTVASYPDLTLGERRQLLGRYRKLAPELRIAICSMAMEKPNLNTSSQSKSHREEASAAGSTKRASQQSS